mgnify:CR=1 FL=1
MKQKGRDIENNVNIQWEKNNYIGREKREKENSEERIETKTKKMEHKTERKGYWEKCRYTVREKNYRVREKREKKNNEGEMKLQRERKERNKMMKREMRQREKMLHETEREGYRERNTLR